jgi:hypothetical protein
MAELRQPSEHRRIIDERFDRAVFKGVSHLSQNQIVLVFEQQGVVLELDIFGHDGLSIKHRERG